MLVLLNRRADASAVAAVCERARQHGLEAIPVAFPAAMVVVLPGAEAVMPPEALRAIAGLPTVERVVETDTPYPLADRRLRPEGTRVQLGEVCIGGKGFAVFVELGEFAPDVLARLVAVRRAGAVGAVFSLPAVNSRAEQGRLRQALAQVRQQSGALVGVDVHALSELAELEGAVDFFRVPAARMQDFRLLRSVGRQHLPVLLERGLSATLEEFLLAAEYILSGGNERVLLCERGIRSFDPATARATLDLAGAVRLSELTHLPVLVNPAGGQPLPSTVARLARAAAVAGLQGIVLTVAAHEKVGAGVRLSELDHLLASLVPCLRLDQRELIGRASSV